MSELRKKAMTRLAICAVALVASIIFSVALLRQFKFLFCGRHEHLPLYTVCSQGRAAVPAKL